MSQTNRDRKRTAVERMHEERRRQEARDRRMRTMRVVGGVVAVVAIAGVAGVLVAGRGDDSESSKSVAVPAGASGDGRVVISVGETDAPATLDVYEDFRCPACGMFEAKYHKTINKLVAKGKVRVDYHLASFIDGNMGGTGSKFAANAAACAQDFGGFADYHDVLYANQPKENEDAFGQKDRLIELAQKVPELKANKEYDTCVDDGVYDGWVSRSQEAFNESGFSSTPTVLLDGKDVFADKQNPVTPRKLAKRIRAAGKERAPGAAESTEPSESTASGDGTGSQDSAQVSAGASAGAANAGTSAGTAGTTGSASGSGTSSGTGTGTATGASTGVSSSGVSAGGSSGASTGASAGASTTR